AVPLCRAKFRVRGRHLCCGPHGQPARHDLQPGVVGQCRGVAAMSILRAMMGLMLMIGTASGWAAQAQPQLAAMTWAALEQAVTSPPAGPVLVASYPPLDGQPAPILALRGVAFT